MKTKMKMKYTEQSDICFCAVSPRVSHLATEEKVSKSVHPISSIGDRTSVLQVRETEKR